MEQIRALNALEPFLALSKSATSPRAAADLITQATSATHTFVFAELLQTPNIQALSQTQEYAGYLKLLEIFAWGTWNDYVNNQSELPPLNDQQTHKLRLLTLLTLLTTPSTPTSTSLTYTHLQQALSLPSPRALEDLIISAIYASLLTGALSPAAQTVDIASVAALRDCAPGSTPTLARALDAWSGRCATELQSLDAQIAAIRARATREARRRRAQEEGFERAMQALEKEKAKQGNWGVGIGGASGAGVGAGVGGRGLMGGGGGGGGGGNEGVKRSAGEDGEDIGDVMDVDGESTGGRKRGGPGGGTFSGMGRR